MKDRTVQDLWSFLQTVQKYTVYQALQPFLEKKNLQRNTTSSEPNSSFK